MYVRNIWYVAAESLEVAHGALLARTIANQKLVFLRTSDDVVVAFDDACPHRYAPLSLGHIENDCLRCPYHGSLFDRDGRCVEVPGQGTAHGKSVQLRSYPIVERYAYIWIWLGDPGRADASAIPEWFAPAESNNRQWQGRADKFLSMPVYYELINDNLHDVSHVEFVHPETLGTTVIPKMYRMAEKEFTPACYVKKDFGATEFRIDYHAENIQGGPVLHQMLAFQRHCDEWLENVDWDLTLRYAAPGHFLFNHRTKDVAEADDAAIQIASLHSVTPETEMSSHYFFYTAHNLRASASRCEEFTQLCGDALAFAFNQDKVLITAQMDRVPDGGRSADTIAKVSFMGDTVPMLGRRIIQKLLKAEIDQ